jgi:hypothetical protein
MMGENTTKHFLVFKKCDSNQIGKILRKLMYQGLRKPWKGSCMVFRTFYLQGDLTSSGFVLMFMINSLRSPEHLTFGISPFIILSTPSDL